MLINTLTTFCVLVVEKLFPGWWDGRADTSLTLKQLGHCFQNVILFSNVHGVQAPFNSGEGFLSRRYTAEVKLSPARSE